jgi:glycosyltransferase involved in cell wall biosynthesis
MDNITFTGTLENVRVLLVDLSKRFGGASVRTLTLARHLAPWQTAIAGLKESPVVKMAQERNIPVWIVGENRADPLIPFRLRDVIRRENFQVVDTQNIQSKFWGSLSSLLTDFAFVSTLNSSYSDENAGSWKGKAYSMLDRLTNHNTNRYIAVSKSIFDGLLRAGVPIDMVDLVTNAVDIDESLSSNDSKLTRQQIGVPENAILYISVGRLVWAKGYEDLIEAFGLVVGKVPNAHSVILGEGELFESLTAQIRQAGLTDRIYLLGYYNHHKVLDVLMASDVFVMTSRSEGVPYALLEAAALGLPILATHCGGIPEVLTDQMDALLVPVGDISSITSGLVHLAENKNFSSELGRNARTKIKREFGLSAQIQATRNSYLKALDHKKRAG